MTVIAHVHIPLYMCVQVTVIGDGCSEVVTVAGDRLWDADALDKVGTDVALPGAIKNSCKSLSKKVFRYVRDINH